MHGLSSGRPTRASASSTRPPSDEVEPYPRASADDDCSAEFLGRRFDQAVQPLPPLCVATVGLIRNGEYVGSTSFWAEISHRTSQLLCGADPAPNYVITELVHCKSPAKVGAAAAAQTCAGRYLPRDHETDGLAHRRRDGSGCPADHPNLVARAPPPAWHPSREPTSAAAPDLPFIDQPGSNQRQVIHEVYPPVLDEPTRSRPPRIATRGVFPGAMNGHARLKASMMYPLWSAAAHPELA
jgi:hypothetical protein